MLLERLPNINSKLELEEKRNNNEKMKTWDGRKPGGGHVIRNEHGIEILGMERNGKHLERYLGQENHSRKFLVKILHIVIFK